MFIFIDNETYINICIYREMYLYQYRAIGIKI